MDKPNPYYRKVRTAPRVTRILIGAGLVIGGIFGFLPVLGVWMIPLVQAETGLWWKQKRKQFS